MKLELITPGSRVYLTNIVKDFGSHGYLTLIIPGEDLTQPKCLVKLDNGRSILVEHWQIEEVE